MVQPPMDFAKEMIGHSVTHSTVAIQAAYVLNGGALAGLPPLMSALSKAGSYAIALAAIPFVIGIIASGICSLAAYFNFQWQMEMYSQRANIAALQIMHNYSPTPVTPYVPPSEASLEARILLSLYVGVSAALISLLSFVAGVSIFIFLALHFPAK
jgi:hypothetical protein